MEKAPIGHHIFSAHRQPLNLQTHPLHQSPSFGLAGQEMHAWSPVGHPQASYHRLPLLGAFPPLCTLTAGPAAGLAGAWAWWFSIGNITTTFQQERRLCAIHEPLLSPVEDDDGLTAT